MNDMVHHPAHYTCHPSGVECRDLAEPWGFYKGSIIKYLFRWNMKGSPRENLEKALQYIEFDIEYWEVEYLPTVAKFLSGESNKYIHDAMKSLLTSDYVALQRAKAEITVLLLVIQENVPSEPAAE